VGWIAPAEPVLPRRGPSTRRRVPGSRADQDDRIEIPDGLVRGEPVKAIAVRIGKSCQSVYREIARNRKPDCRYQPWYAHRRAHLRRRRPGRGCSRPVGLAAVVAAKLEQRWSPGQISRWLRRRYPRKQAWHVCTETIYDAVYRGLIVPTSPGLLRTARTYRHRRGRGRSRDAALPQCTTMKPLRNRPPIAESRRQAGTGKEISSSAPGTARRSPRFRLGLRDRARSGTCWSPTGM
jgi:IS30 family transposase